jgi:WD40 repeat protein
MRARQRFFLGAICLGLVGYSCVSAIEIFYGRKTITLYGHSSFLFQVAISPDGKTAASSSWDEAAQQWDVELWDVAAAQERARLLVGRSVDSLAFSPDNELLASGSSEGTIRLWDVATGELRAALRGHTEEIGSLAFSADGKTLASGSSDETVRLWDVATGRCRATLPEHGWDWAGSVALSPDGKTLASASGDWTVKPWDVTTGRKQATVRAQPEATTTAVAFSPDGSLLATGNADASDNHPGVVLWDAANGRQRGYLAIPKWRPNSYVHYVGFSPDGKMTAAIEGPFQGPTAIHVWDTTSGQNTANLDPYDDDQKSIATMVDTVLEKLPASFRRPSAYVKWTSVFFSPSGRLHALGGGNLDEARGSQHIVRLLELPIAWR